MLLFEILAVAQMTAIVLVSILRLKNVEFQFAIVTSRWR